MGLRVAILFVYFVNIKNEKEISLKHWISPQIQASPSIFLHSPQKNTNGKQLHSLKQLTVWILLFFSSSSLFSVEMAAVTSVSFSAIAQSAERKSSVSPSRSVDTFRFRSNLSFDCFNVRSSNSSFSSNSSTSRFVVHCMSTGKFSFMSRYIASNWIGNRK